MAPGIVTADTNRKTVQHLDGGVIAEIAARDGDRVEARQVLMRLDDLETRSVVTLLEGQRRAYAAQEARLLAERDDREKLIFPKDLADLRSLRRNGGDPVRTGTHLSEPACLPGRAGRRDTPAHRPVSGADQGIRGPVHAGQPAARPDPGGACGRQGTDGERAGT